MKSSLHRFALLLAALSPLSAHADSALPPEAAVRQALLELPSVRAGQGEIARGEAWQRQLEAGPHEWAVTLEGQQRRSRDAMSGPDRHTQDWAVGVERAWRLPGKAALDTRLGQEQRAIAEAAAEERLHNGARLLLETWFAWLRAQQRLTQIEAARTTLAKETRAIQRRRELGDASELETLQIEAALAQMEAEQQTREAELHATREQLQQRFPGLPLPTQLTLSPPQAIEGNLEQWEQELLTHEPGLRLARLESSRSQLQAQRTDRERLADPTVGVRLTRERMVKSGSSAFPSPFPSGGAPARPKPTAAGPKPASPANRKPRRCGKPGPAPGPPGNRPGALTPPGAPARMPPPA